MSKVQQLSKGKVIVPSEPHDWPILDEPIKPDTVAAENVSLSKTIEQLQSQLDKTTSLLGEKEEELSSLRLSLDEVHQLIDAMSQDGDENERIRELEETLACSQKENMELKQEIKLKDECIRRARAEIEKLNTKAKTLQATINNSPSEADMNAMRHLRQLDKEKAEEDKASLRKQINILEYKVRELSTQQVPTASAPRDFRVQYNQMPMAPYNFDETTRKYYEAQVLGQSDEWLSSALKIDVALQEAIDSKLVTMGQNDSLLCNACEIFATGTVAMSQHLQGDKHKKKLAAIRDRNMLREAQRW
jgi:uncharacterized phage infection (PIP) family protein YhgE